VVTYKDVLQAIDTLGSLEDIINTETEESDNNHKYAKRLYRDPDKCIIGGVCAGIAARTGINPIIIRVIFVIACMLYGASVFIYLILWIIIPLAKTTAQKLEMRGQPININNIEKSIKDNLSSQELEQSFHQVVNNTGKILHESFKIFLRIFGIVLGTGLCLTGIGILLSLISLFFLQDLIFNDTIEWELFSFNELFQHILSPVSYRMIYICVILTVSMFVLACLYWGIKIISGFKVKYKKLHIALILIWFTAIFTLIAVSLYEVNNYKWNNEIHEVITVENPKPVIRLAVNSFENPQIANNPLEVSYNREYACFYGKPELYILESPDNKIELKIRKESQGKTKYEAFQYAEGISYDVVLSDSLIIFPQYFEVSPPDEWKFQQMRLLLYIPENTVIIVDKALYNDRIGHRFPHNHDSNYSFIMTKKGLKNFDK
jgi:phage shock protein PspC (stress-responsive transcriptional regulator)